MITMTLLIFLTISMENSEGFIYQIVSTEIIAHILDYYVLIFCILTILKNITLNLYEHPSNRPITKLRIYY